MDSTNANFVIERCLIEHNSCARDGGCLNPNGGSLAVTDCVLRNCTAGRYGGGVFTTGTSTVTLKRVLIIDSHATGIYDPESRVGGGGGFCGTGGVPRLTDVAIINCTSWGVAGGGAISTEVAMVAINLSVTYSCQAPPALANSLRPPAPTGRAPTHARTAARSAPAL